jgi:NADH:ubiquinone reductase (non-electrogenic)
LLQNNDNIQFVQKSIHGIDVNNNKVYLTDCNSDKCSTTSTALESIPYNSLVVATGSSINLSFIPGATQYALPFYTLQHCYQLRKQLSILDLYIQQLQNNNTNNTNNSNNSNNSNEKEVSIVIVGGGYSGVELALNLRQRLNTCNDNKSTVVNINITILHRGQEVLQYANDYNRRNGQQRLENAGIDIITQQSVVQVLPPPSEQQLAVSQSSSTEEASLLKHRCRIITNTNSTIDADLLLWTAGAMSNNEQRDILNSKLPRDTYGKIITNQFLQVKNYPNIYALGDCARTKKVPYPATAAVAMQQAPVVAWNIFSSNIKLRQKQDSHLNLDIANTYTDYEKLPFEYLDLGQMMTLGGDDATISSFGVFELDGSIASFARRLVYAIRMPTLQQALTAALSSTNKRLEKSGITKVKKIINWK